MALLAYENIFSTSSGGSMYSWPPLLGFPSIIRELSRRGGKVDLRGTREENGAILMASFAPREHEAGESGRREAVAGNNEKRSVEDPSPCGCMVILKDTGTCVACVEVHTFLGSQTFNEKPGCLLIFRCSGRGARRCGRWGHGTTHSSPPWLCSEVPHPHHSKIPRGLLAQP